MKNISKIMKYTKNCIKTLLKIENQNIKLIIIYFKLICTTLITSRFIANQYKIPSSFLTPSVCLDLFVDPSMLAVVAYAHVHESCSFGGPQ